MLIFLFIFCADWFAESLHFASHEKLYGIGIFCAGGYRQQCPNELFPTEALRYELRYNEIPLNELCLLPRYLLNQKIKYNTLLNNYLFT